ncbi:NAD(P)H-dependent oxidoreductase [Curtobacterium sp. ODYSSEY 48 V2]|uniref:FMN-dependent NADH-azoreductase n=1 Tax=Curtobacterium sp. ODYSSEY 48 V2 TaxID=2939561 RepID=UPI00203DD391|nr:NAD(P)H-dependent oxidoreductase [Curtobacterium sp. ODYSSEY 48 V2]MCM3506506.1 NAD(P)H-dependent oxidoreductase [Curtobacterium sp. ODYSSEY 48 V2]
MAVLLHIDSSSLGSASVSRQVAQSFLAEWQGEVVHRDLAAQPVPHLTAAGITARTTPAENRTADEADAAAIQDELINEILAADAYLFTVPLYNYSMPSVFKAWLDQVLVPGRTLGFGPEGAATAGRPAVLISARGGGYGPGTPNHGKDFAVPALEVILGDPKILGMDVRVITPELTYAPTMPALAELIPLHEASMEASHREAQAQAQALTASLAA